jgi:hypothetical protein
MKPSQGKLFTAGLLCLTKQCLLIAAVLLLNACDGDMPSGTSTSATVSLDTNSAQPFQVVSISGISPNVTFDSTVTVGGQNVPLIYNPVTQEHGFVVPGDIQGFTEVGLTAQLTGNSSALLNLQVLPQEFVGGSIAAAEASLNEILDDIQFNAALLTRILDSEQDAVFLELADAMNAAGNIFRETMRNATEAEKAYILGVYSANSETFDFIASFFADEVEGIRSLPPSYVTDFSTQQTRQQTTPNLPTAEFYARRCIQKGLEVEALEDASKGLSRYGIIVPALISLPPIAQPQLATLVATQFTVLGSAVDIAVNFAKLAPKFFDPDGLQLKSSSSRVPQDGGTGELTASINLVNYEDALTDIDLGIQEYRQFRSLYSLDSLNKKISNLESLAGNLASIGVSVAISELLDVVKSSLEELYQTQDVSFTNRRVPIAMDGVTITNASYEDLWQFTSPSTGYSRSFETTGTIPPDEAAIPVSIVARTGRGANCTAEARLGDGRASEGINGFLITGGSVIRFNPSQISLDIEAGSSESVRVTVENAGFEVSDDLTYSIEAFEDEPFGLSVSSVRGPSTLDARESGTVRFSISARPDSPEQLPVVLVKAFEDGQEVAEFTVFVGIKPQLSDIDVGQQQILMQLADYGQQDGDLVNITLNGSSVVSGHSLVNAGTTFNLSLRPGRNIIVIEALNEGSISPNTAEIGFGDVTRGEAVQRYGMRTGQRVQIIMSTPTTTNPTGRSASLPPRLPLLECGDDAGDCIGE